MHHRVIAILFLIMFGMFGCSTPPPPIEEGVTEEEALQTLEVAWLYHDYITEELIPEKEYDPDRFQDASKWLLRADDYFVEGGYSDALTYASKSLGVFQQIVQDFAQRYYIPELENTLEELETIIADDPDNPLVEFIPALQQMLKNANDLQRNDLKGSAQAIEEMKKDIEQFRQLQKIINEGQRVEQEIGDVVFETGQYHLAEQGKALLDGFARDIADMEAERRKVYPEKKISVKIKVIGYTDEQGFRYDSKIAKELLDEAKQDAPNDRDLRDQMLNQLLSEKRAQNIAEHLGQLISAMRQDSKRTQIKLEIIGKGEDVPSSVEPPYPEKDARRRISRIYSYVLAH